MPAPDKPAGDNHGRSSPALSQSNSVKDTIASRKIAILAADGVDSSDIAAVGDALTGAGATCEVLAARDGTLQAANGSRIEVTRALPTVASVLYDAVVVPGGERAARTLSGDGGALHFIAEAFKHGKAVGAIGDGAALLPLAHVRGLQPNGDGVTADRGVVVAEASGDHAEFNHELVQAVARHRHWDRAIEAVPA